MQVSHQDDVDISDTEFQLAHGKSKFMDAEKVGKLVREYSGGGARAVLACDGVLASQVRSSQTISAQRSHFGAQRPQVSSCPASQTS